MDELNNYFRFDDTDLEANRNRKFSAKQQSDWRVGRIQDLKFGFSMLPVVTILFALFVYLLRDSNRSMALLCLVYVFFFGLLMAGGFWFAFKRDHHTIHKIEGAISLRPHFHPDWDEDGFKHSVLDSYYLTVGGKSFLLNTGAEYFLKRITQGDIYAVYYDAENPGTILSLELLSSAN